MELTIQSLIENSRTGICVLVFGYIFSPLLHTLTDSASTDTIFSFTGFVMFLHLVCFDYGITDFIVSRAISLNAAIFGAICLASRLSSSFHAFVLLTTSTIFFALGPILLNRFWAPWWVAPGVLVCTYFLYQVSTPVLVTYILSVVFLNGFCPYAYYSQQKNKYNIYGPWDEAIPDADTEPVSENRTNQRNERRNPSH